MFCDIGPLFLASSKNVSMISCRPSKRVLARAFTGWLELLITLTETPELPATAPPSAKAGSPNLERGENPLPKLLSLFKRFKPSMLADLALMTYSPFESQAGIESDLGPPGPETAPPVANFPMGPPFACGVAVEKIPPRFLKRFENAAFKEALVRAFKRFLPMFLKPCDRVSVPDIILENPEVKLFVKICPT